MNNFAKVLLLIFALVGSMFILSGCACRTNQIAAYPSPDNKTKAVIYQFDCGATTGYSTHVAILPMQEEIVKSPFSADGVKGAVFRMDNAYFRSNGGPLKLYLNVKWLDDKHLEINYPEDFEVYKTNENYGDIMINYQTYKLK